MSDKNSAVDIISQIIGDERINQAIMINGEWGSGKTYFIKTILIKKLKQQFEEKKIIYISAYGKSNINDIESELYKGIIKASLDEKTLEKYEKSILAAPLIEGTISLATQYVNKDLKKLAKSVLDKSKSNFEYKDIILILDDVERCKIDIDELFGFLNNFVEHKKLNLIISCNEKEIIQQQVYTKFEAIGLLAKEKIKDEPKQGTENPYDVLFEKSNKEKDADRKETSEVDFNDLMANSTKIIKEIFPYKRIKEKLIGVTIQHKIELESVYNDLVKDYAKHKRYQRHLIEEREGVLKIFSNEDNIRTLQFFILTYERFFILIDERIISDQLKQNTEYEVLIELMQNIAKATILYKKGEHKNLQTEFNEVKEYIVNRVFNESSFIDSYATKINEWYSMNNVECLKKLKYWTDLNTDKEVENEIEKVHALVISNDMKIDYVADIIYLLISLKVHGFNVDLDNIMDDMITNISQDKSLRISIVEDGFYRKKQMLEKSEVKAELEKTSKIFVTALSEKVNDGFSGEDILNWDNGQIVCKAGKDSVFRIRESFLGTINMNIFFERIEKVKNVKFFNSLHGLLHEFYSVQYMNLTYFKNDKENIEKLIDYLQDIKLNEVDKKLSAIRIKWIVSLLEEYIEENEKLLENQ